MKKRLNIDDVISDIVDDEDAEAMYEQGLVDYPDAFADENFTDLDDEQIKTLSQALNLDDDDDL